MARGFLSGAIWGVVVSGVSAGAVSVAMGPPDRPDPAQLAADDVAVVAPEPVDDGAMPDPQQGPDAETAKEPDTTKVMAPPAKDPLPQTQDAGAAPAVMADAAKPGRRPQAETGFEAPKAPGGALDAPDGPFSAEADTDLPQQPVIGAAPDAPLAADPASETAEVSVTTDAPVQPLAQAEIPGAPVAEDSLDISTDPAQPPIPAVPEAETALIVEEAPVVEEPQPEDVAEQAPAPELEQPEAVAELETAEAPVEPESVAEPEPQEAPEPQPEPEQVAVAAPEPEVENNRPSIGKPAGSFLDRDTGVQTSRLPRLGADTADPSADAPQTETPLNKFAAKPDPAPAADLPRISVILIDDKVDTWGPEALKTLPIPVSIAIPPSHPEATKTAEAYRKLGFEVLAMADIPEGAEPSDVEVTLSGTLQTIPEAVAILEDPAGGVQSSRAVSSQTAAFLAESGHGLVMLPKGLNTAQQLAAKAGVPSASLFRDMDKDNQDAAHVRRSLDQGAFRAKQQGSVIMLGRLHANTLSGLIQWGLQDKNASIAIVPVSTVLQEASQE